MPQSSSTFSNPAQKVCTDRPCLYIRAPPLSLPQGSFTARPAIGKLETKPKDFQNLKTAKTSSNLARETSSTLTYLWVSMPRGVAPMLWRTPKDLEVLLRRNNLVKKVQAEAQLCQAQPLFSRADKISNRSLVFRIILVSKSPNLVPPCQGLLFQGTFPFLSVFLTPSDKTWLYSSRLTCGTQLSPHKQGAKLAL